MVLKSLVGFSEGNKLIVSGSWGPENKMQIKSSQLKRKGIQWKSGSFEHKT